MTRTQCFAALAVAALLPFAADAQTTTGQNAPTTPQGNTPAPTVRAAPATQKADAPTPSGSAPSTAPAGTPAGAPAAAAPAAETPRPPPGPPPAGDTAVPGWNNPPSWSNVDTRPQYASVPGRETNVLVSESGRRWRELRNGPVTFYGGVLLLVVPVLILLFYMVKGQIKLHEKPTGRLIERFNSAERMAHWTMAISFVVLAVSGLTILFGKYVLLPVLGYNAFAGITVVLKNVHNFVGPLFIFSIVVSFFIFVRDNFWAACDWVWLKSFGGMFGGKHIRSGRFNAGEKAWFWGGMVLLGALVAASGTIMLFPNWNTTRAIMGDSNLVHAVAAVVFIAVSLGHIYIGTIGMQGAYKAMREGYVDEAWAREHHEIWYEQVKNGERPEKIVGAAPQPVAGDD